MNEPVDAETLKILGVEFRNASMSEAISQIEKWMRTSGGRTRSLYIANAHTLNLAAEDPRYHEVLNRADMVYGDGTGVRWGAKLRGVHMRENLVGTDLVPQLFAATASRGYKYYLLGSTEDTIARAADYCRRNFAGWELTGYHHGYVWNDEGAKVVDEINRSGAHLLLVGMGNPLQERWIDQNRNRLSIPVAIGVGGLFNHWSGELTRAPKWVRRLGFEWLQILLQQPGKKWRRYLLGNPAFLWRILVRAPFERASREFKLPGRHVAKAALDSADSPLCPADIRPQKADTP